MTRRLVAGLLLAVFASACSAHKPWGRCAVGGAIIGGAAGGITGGAIANNATPPFKKQDEDRAAGIGIGVATGAILGALIGHALCDEEEVVAAPVPPPPPPPPPTRRKIVLRGVNFDFDKSNIRKDAAPILDEAARTLSENKEIRVSVEGHCDSKGTDAYNDKLSMRRSASVKTYIAKKGVASDRLSTKGYGESKPVADNSTADGRAQNRRVELMVLD